MGMCLLYNNIGKQIYSSVQGPMIRRKSQTAKHNFVKVIRLSNMNWTLKSVVRMGVFDFGVWIFLPIAIGHNSICDKHHGFNLTIRMNC